MHHDGEVFIGCANIFQLELGHFRITCYHVHKHALISYDYNCSATMNIRIYRRSLINYHDVELMHAMDDVLHVFCACATVTVPPPLVEIIIPV